MTVRGSFGARTFGLLAMSASSHAIVFSALGLVPPPSRVLAMHEAEFEVMAPKPPPPEPPKIKEPEKLPDPPKEAPKAAPRAAAPKPAAAPPPPSAAPPQEAADEVEDFTGVTLTAEGGSSWSTAVGSGAALTGPIGKIGRAKSEPTQQAAKVGPVGPRVVPLGSLGRKPSAPSGLDALLQQHYPRRAQLQGVEGKVVVRMKILPSGRVTNIQVVKETPPEFGFGTACEEFLRASPPWEPPLDVSGKAVATDVTFNCSFEVDD